VLVNHLDEQRRTGCRKPFADLAPDQLDAAVRGFAVLTDYLANRTGKPHGSEGASC